MQGGVKSLCCMMQREVKTMTVAEIFLLHVETGSQIFLLHFAEGRCDSLLHLAAGHNLAAAFFSGESNLTTA